LVFVLDSSYMEREGGHLAVAQMGLRVGLSDALGERRLVVAPRPDEMPLLAHDDGGARVLAHRQNAARCDVRVLQQLDGDETVVVGGLRVVEDAAQLRQMGRAEEVGSVPHGAVGEQAQALGVDLEHVVALEGPDGDVVGRELSVGSRVLPRRKDLAVDVLRHRGLLDAVFTARGRSVREDRTCGAAAGWPGGRRVAPPPSPVGPQVPGA
jgi:hypothetical protein